MVIFLIGNKKLSKHVSREKLYYTNNKQKKGDIAILNQIL